MKELRFSTLPFSFLLFFFGMLTRETWQVTIPLCAVLLPQCILPRDSGAPFGVFLANLGKGYETVLRRTESG